MTKPTAGGTKHNWLVEDLAAVVSDLRHTADGILRDLDNYQESREEVYLSSLATRIARLFQEIARITTVQARNAPPDRRCQKQQERGPERRPGASRSQNCAA